MVNIYILVVFSEVRNMHLPPAAPRCSFTKSLAAECLGVKLFGDSSLEL